MPRVRLERAAKAELHAAIAWYEAQMPGLGAELHAEVDAVLSKLAEGPGTGTTVPSVSEGLQVRRVFTDRFPYAIVFMTWDETVDVIAVAHTRRKPGYWLDRTKP